MSMAGRPDHRVLLWLLLSPLLYPSLGLRLGVLLPAEEAAASQGHHDLRDVARVLGEQGHDVKLLTAGEGSHNWEAAITEPEGLFPAFDAILADGAPATQVADYATRWGTPVVRFMPDSDAALEAFESFEPHRERPAVLVFGSAADAGRFRYVEEGQHVVLHLDAAGDSKNSFYVELGSALAAAAAGQPRPGPVLSAEQASGQCTEGEGVCAAFAAPPVRAEEGDAPLLGLVMIVKDENATIATTLESIKGDIDYWTIVDTGSTDGTQDTIDAVMAGIPGQQLSQPFVDFSTTRNFALQAHGQRTQWAFMLDADFEVQGGWRLRLAVHRLSRECRQRSVMQCPKGVKVWFKLGDVGFFSNRVFPTDGLGTEAGWHYVYPVHEVPSHKGLAYLNQAVIDDVIKHDGVTVQNLPITHTKSSTRWKNMDLPLLLAERERDPTDTRTVFYLAQTYELIEEREAALATYQARIAMGGWQQEVFESHLRRGRIKFRHLEALSHLNPTNESALDPAPDLLAALALQPQRAEPLVQLSKLSEWLRDHWCPWDHDPQVCKLQHEVAAYDYARQAAGMPFPGGDTLFADVTVYEYGAQEQLAITAWYVAKQFSDAFEVGMEAAQRLLQRFPGDERRRTNLEWYERLRSGAVS